MGRWKPGYGERYHYINSKGGVDRVRWNNDGFDHEYYEHGNCFSTRAEAEAAAEKVKALLLNFHDNVSLGMKVFEELDVFKKEICKPSLPKLTAEVFDRPDCPEWAKYAVVNMHGTGYFYEDEPSYGTENYKGMWYVDTGKVSMMKNAIFNASDWQNSLIERPSKAAFDKLLKNCAEQQANKILQKARERRLPEQYHNGPEKTTLPDWCKVGEWVFDKAINKYSQVAPEDITEHLQEVCKSISKGEIVSARLRPYNVDEMKALVGKVIERYSSAYLVISYAHDDLETTVYIEGKYLCADNLLRDFTINGKPCGVFEHLKNGEWIE